MLNHPRQHQDRPPIRLRQLRPLLDQPSQVWTHRASALWTYVWTWLMGEFASYKSRRLRNWQEARFPAHQSSQSLFR